LSRFITHPPAASNSPVIRSSPPISNSSSTGGSEGRQHPCHGQTTAATLLLLRGYQFPNHPFVFPNLPLFFHGRDRKGDLEPKRNNGFKTETTNRLRDGSM
jgi:hypothetical protein